jgi:predicted DCC family thiol-disulfide oxidoreductase YuxK
MLGEDMKRLTILYDGSCGFCVRCRRWLERQPTYLRLEFLKAGSPEAIRRYPTLTRPGIPEELVVVSDEGFVYRAGRAWIIILYALKEYREWALWMSHPALLPLARKAIAFLSSRRSWISWLFGLDAEFDEALRCDGGPGCRSTGDGPGSHPHPG